MGAPLDSAQRGDVEAQSVGRFLLRPPVGSTQLDQAPTNVSHHAVRALHARNGRRLDLIETEVKYPLIAMFDVVSNVARGGLRCAVQW